LLVNTEHFLIELVLDRYRLLTHGSRPFPLQINT
jgi:hypothetical protein